jgi:hypothetical protein
MIGCGNVNYSSDEKVVPLLNECTITEMGINVDGVLEKLRERVRIVLDSPVEDIVIATHNDGSYYVSTPSTNFDIDFSTFEIGSVHIHVGKIDLTL